MKDVTGRVQSLESFGSVAGPGVRFVVFLQGCKMRCRYCHNPETWKMNGGEEWTAEKLFSHIVRYKKYWGSDGGITVSGGEPLLQIDFVTALFKQAKENGINTVLDTSGQPFCKDKEFLDKFNELIKYTDLVILDLKTADPKRHEQLTGFTNENIFEMARYLSDNNKDMWIRRVLVPNLTDDEEDLRHTRDFISELKTVKRVEVLPYHAFGIPKWEKLGMNYSLKDTVSPTNAQMERAKEILGI